MADDEGHYSPPPLIFDADEATAVTQPLLAETGQTESKQDSAQPDQAAHETQAVHIPPQSPASADQRYTTSHTPEYTAPTGLDLTSLPDGIATWHEQRGLQILWAWTCEVLSRLSAFWAM